MELFGKQRKETFIEEEQQSLMQALKNSTDTIDSDKSSVRLKRLLAYLPKFLSLSSKKRSCILVESLEEINKLINKEADITNSNHAKLALEELLKNKQALKALRNFYGKNDVVLKLLKSTFYNSQNNYNASTKHKTNTVEANRKFEKAYMRYIKKLQSSTIFKEKNIFTGKNLEKNYDHIIPSEVKNFDNFFKNTELLIHEDLEEVDKLFKKLEKKLSLKMQDFLIETKFASKYIMALLVGSAEILYNFCVDNLAKTKEESETKNGGKITDNFQNTKNDLANLRSFIMKKSLKTFMIVNNIIKKFSMGIPDKSLDAQDTKSNSLVKPFITCAPTTRKNTGKRF